jgi:hypothetical protein
MKTAYSDDKGVANNQYGNAESGVWFLQGKERQIVALFKQ